MNRDLRQPRFQNKRIRYDADVRTEAHKRNRFNGVNRMHTFQTTQQLKGRKIRLIYE